MPLPWIRLDTSMPDNPKILRMIDSHGVRGLAAGFVWVCGLAFSGKHGTDGLIERSALTRVNGNPTLARVLVENDLWVPAPGGGWETHDWRDYNESNDETRARSERAKAAADKRWHPNGMRGGMPDA